MLVISTTMLNHSAHKILVSNMYRLAKSVKWDDYYVHMLAHYTFLSHLYVSHNNS